MVWAAVKKESSIQWPQQWTLLFWVPDLLDLDMPESEGGINILGSILLFYSFDISLYGCYVATYKSVHMSLFSSTLKSLHLLTFKRLTFFFNICKICTEFYLFE